MPYSDCHEHATDKDAEDNQQYSTHIIIIHLSLLNINRRYKNNCLLCSYIIVELVESDSKARFFEALIGETPFLCRSQQSRVATRQIPYHCRSVVHA